MIMSMPFSKRLNNFPEYVFAMLDRKKKEVEVKTGRKVLNLGVGSPDFPPAEQYIKKLQQFVTLPKIHMYPPYGPMPEFVKAIQDWHLQRFAVELAENEIYQLNGGKDGLSHLPLAILDEGDEVLIPDPGYTGFAGPLLLYNMVPVPYTLSAQNGFKINVKDLDSKLSSKTKALIINYPSNPTGQTITLTELKPIVDWAIQKQIWIIYDNPYADLVFDGTKSPSILQVPGAKQIAVELGSFSKTLSFAGDRMGWIVGNSDLIKAFAKVKSQIDTGLSKYLQLMGAYALQNFDQKWYQSMLKSYMERAEILAKVLSTEGMTFSKPKASLYIWAKLPASYQGTSEQYTFDLLENKQILVAPGSAYGQNGEGYIRVSICADLTDIDQYFPLNK